MDSEHYKFTTKMQGIWPICLHGSPSGCGRYICIYIYGQWTVFMLTEYSGRGFLVAVGPLCGPCTLWGSTPALLPQQKRP